MPAETLEQPRNTDTLPTPPKSMFDSPEFTAEIEAALVKDGRMIAPPSTIPPVEPPKDDPKETPKDAPKPADKPVENDDDRVPEDIKSPAAQSSWKKLKESKKALETTLRDKESTLAEKEKAYETLRTEFEAFKLKQPGTHPAVKAEELPEYKSMKQLLEAREKENAEYSERLRLLDVERHPKFEAYFKSKIEAQHNMAKNIGGDKALELLRMPASEYRDQQLDALILELSPVKAAQFGAVITRLSEIDAERQSEITKARENYATIQAEQKQLSERQQAEVEQTFKAVTGEFADKEKGWAAFQERDGDAEWNKGVRERLALAERIYGGDLKPDERARAAYWAAAAPIALAQLQAIDRESKTKIADLEKQLNELRAVQPNPGAGGAGDPSNQEKYVPGLAGMMAEIEKILPGAR